ncbi:MAG: 16S rRNA (guanine(527)-N(7))-methyltransferase RsmG [Syntrophales bacterium]|jgi:16S rRNA (guanine527-N7)-methyltransferase
MEKSVSQIFSEAANTMGIALGDRETSMFTIYYHELVAWNKKISLISTKSERDIIIKHFIDSLTLLPYIKSETCRVLDIGSGAGFPGIPLKIAVNSLKVFLLESSRKKSSFLKHVIRSLGLADTVVIHDRAEFLMEDETCKDFYQVVTSRAAFKLPQFLRMGAFFLAPKGSLIAMKGKISDQELTDAAGISRRLGLEYTGSHDLTLPITGDFRRIIIYEKLSL